MSISWQRWPNCKPRLRSSRGQEAGPQEGTPDDHHRRPNPLLLTISAGTTGNLEPKQRSAHPLQPPKLGGRALATTGVPGLTASRLLHMHDHTTHLTFLVDSGTAVSVLPPTAADRKSPQPHFQLQAANGSKIRTFGRRSLTLNLGLRRALPWIFVVAEVQNPILGADFLYHFHLTVDLNRRALVDNTTDLSISGLLAPSTSPTPSLPQPSSPPNEFTSLLAEFPQLTQPHNYKEEPS